MTPIIWGNGGSEVEAAVQGAQPAGGAERLAPGLVFTRGQRLRGPGQEQSPRPPQGGQGAAKAWRSWPDLPPSWCL